MIERIALAYSDGSYGVLSEATTIDAARHERDDADRNERDPANATRILRVRLEVVESLDDWRPTPTPISPAKALSCHDELVGAVNGLLTVVATLSRSDLSENLADAVNKRIEAANRAVAKATAL
jgi:hypothetical protein